MSNTIILRFSDFEKDTIPEHIKVINNHKSVWWGWWKKKHEPFDPILSRIKEELPITIGLINRSGETGQPECYYAICQSIALKDTGEAILSPNMEKTPEYYKGSSHPAWFEFSEIIKIELSEFEARFGGIPEGEPTLFSVEITNGKPNLIMIPDDKNSDNISVNGDSILHISDIHLGKEYGFVTSRRKDPIDEVPLEDIISTYISSIENCRIGVVVVSGDITTAGESGLFAQASVFLQNLAKALGIEREHIIIVPGNHDIKLQDIDHPTHNYEHEEPFRFFLQGFYGKDISEIDFIKVFSTPGGWHLSFIGLNSVKPRKAETKEYGYVGSAQYQPLLERLHDVNDGKDRATLAMEKKLNFAILHHHILPANLVCKPEKNRPVSLVLDAGELVQNLQESNVHFVLHGHQHIPFLGSTSRAYIRNTEWAGLTEPLYIIGGGSCGTNRLWDEFRSNSFGIYTPQEGGLDLLVKKFNPSVSPTDHFNLSIPFSVF
ncbi:MAG: metallophosphoesterase [candidate division Zixibacteria bacterium]